MCILWLNKYCRINRKKHRNYLDIFVNPFYVNHLHFSKYFEYIDSRVIAKLILCNSFNTFD